MDSDLLGNDDFLNFSFEIPIEDVSSDPDFLAALKKHLDGIKKDGYFELRSKPLAIELSTGPYGYATIAPIVFTNWSVVTLFKSSSLFDPTRVMPFFLIMITLFIAFVLVTSVFSHKLILTPFEKLIHSLVRVKENDEESVYGLERNDEFGILSNTIHDLFIKANHDALTGLYNRRFLEKTLQRNIESISRHRGVLSVLMIDVDFFKKYNDKYGHDMGDTCLKSVAGALTKSLNRVDDFVARYGGEEFVAVLPGTDEAGARLVADRLLENVRDLNMPHEDSDAAERVTVSIGITFGKVSHTQTPTEYLKRADKAMYRSKQNGRNQRTYLALA
jgi:diguanylate cyclase (GGDEF)-like protein